MNRGIAPVFIHTLTINYCSNLFFLTGYDFHFLQATVREGRVFSTLGGVLYQALCSCWVAVATSWQCQLAWCCSGSGVYGLHSVSTWNVKQMRPLFEGGFHKYTLGHKAAVDTYVQLVYINDGNTRVLHLAMINGDWPHPSMYIGKKRVEHTSSSVSI